MSEYMRWGYDADRIGWIRETTFGQLPTTGQWNWGPGGEVLNFIPKFNPIYKKKVGLGRQILSDMILLKKFMELKVESELLARDGTTWEWIDVFNYAMGASVPGATIDLEKHIASLSIGARIEASQTPTYNYWTCRGCKVNSIILKGNVEENLPVTQEVDFYVQNPTFDTTNYVQGTATHQNKPNTDYLLASDCDITWGGSSFYHRLTEWQLELRRNLVKRGASDADKTLYRDFQEGEVSAAITGKIDFSAISELQDFLANTQRTAAVSLPAGSSGRLITMTGGRITEGDKPIRELTLLDFEFKIEFATINVTTL